MKQTENIPQIPPSHAPIPVITADPAVGLNAEQVRQREQGGLCNITPPTNTRPESQIIRENTFTFFNLIFVVLGLR